MGHTVDCGRLESQCDGLSPVSSCCQDGEHMVNNPALAYLTWVSLHRCVEMIFFLSTGHSTGSPRHVLVFTGFPRHTFRSGGSCVIRYVPRE